MSRDALRTYLNDHVAGSVVAVELLDHLIELHRNSDRQGFYRELQAEIVEDQGVLKNLLSQCGGSESPVRKAVAWMTEKMGRAKLALDDRGDNQLRTWEAMEALALGIQGKLLLWRALAQAPDALSGLRGVDLPRLQARAQQQFDRVDAERLLLARQTLQS
jgi:hypothetical protein